jgi:hypothetical protein
MKSFFGKVLAAEASGGTPAACRATLLHQHHLSGWVMDKVPPGSGKGRVVPGELFPRVGFIVTNMTRSSERVVMVYNQLGTAEQRIKEGKNAIVWAYLSCRRSAASCGATACSGLQPNQLPSYPDLPRSGQQLVHDDLAGPASQDRRKDRPPRADDHVPGGSGRGLARSVPADTRLHRDAASASASSMFSVAVCFDSPGGQQENCIRVAA